MLSTMMNNEIRKTAQERPAWLVKAAAENKTKIRNRSNRNLNRLIVDFNKVPAALN